MNVYVDESGGLGPKGRYFVIAMLIPQNSKRIKNFVRRFCARKGVDEAKGSKLDFPDKQFLLNRLNFANDYTVSYVVADKQNIDNKKILEDSNICYNYLLSFLMRRTIRGAREDVTIILDNHSMKVASVNSLSDYIKIKAYTQWGFSNNLKTDYIDSKKSWVIQAVDVIANAIYAKYTYNTKGLYRMLTVSESIKFPAQKFGK